jgi:uncharacterized phage protein (TIGR01671 family)
MREIKFRALCAVNCSWVYYGTAITGTVDYLQLRKETESQYTGLKDVNGVEIYERDIVSDHNGIGIIKYSEIEAAYKVSYNDGLNDGFSKWFIDYMNRHERNSIEVIGNIHENPELLSC